MKEAQFEFHISKRSRDRYQFDKAIYGLCGNVLLVDFYSVRLFAQKMNERRDLTHNPELAVRPGHINAMGLIDEIIHYVSKRFRQDKNPQALKEALSWLKERFDPELLNAAASRFIDEFPPSRVYQGRESRETYLKGETDIPNLEITIEEMILLNLANNNPAFFPYLELFDDSDLKKTTIYSQTIDSLTEYFKTQPNFGPQDQSLIDLLKSPVKAAPHSLTGQLVYIKDHWGPLISKELLYRTLLALDLIREEDKFHAFGIGMGQGPTQVLDFRETEFGPDYERFSADADWMGRVVLIAKNVYVWFYQLSKKYGRPIWRLDQIPDEELDILARWGFTGLWLIGLWERSPASQRIKQMCGNPEAVSSAYSLYDYTIAGDLGGEEALINLRERASMRGIRLASDMVPNHTGIYSKWTIEHPDWFIQVDYPPFPAYRFTGPNLSSDERVGIYIEDRYWDRQDAAVVFKRVDHWIGKTIYIYHGNDGTHMPWNDTAQLNFLLPEVREAVIQTILHTARLFPIIRFDAAMTLTKRHYQRLWFPEPGRGGDIPSRAGQGKTREEFDRLFPNEFWREVVDRVAQESPDTLLLAEAFWLMEGYFVRTLGMHRVYNSAFMNMLKLEENAKYRSVIKNILEFNPQILMRLVNFMNNPDEETALAQFGKDDKYFGVCLMMVTMPGLPMFGHGQIEGFSEKYGMEYRRPYLDEGVDWDLVSRHEREIFPLMKKRYLFAGARNFVLYDFHNLDGTINEDVFSYSNIYGNERGLIFYQNRFEEARGWIKGLTEGLRLRQDETYYYIFKDHKTGLEYIRWAKELAEKGLYVELGAFKYHIFLDWREVEDTDLGYYRNLCQYLNGRPVPSIEEAGFELYLAPIHTPFKEIINPYILRELVSRKDPGVLKTFGEKLGVFSEALKAFVEVELDKEIIIRRLQVEFSMILPPSTRFKRAIEYLHSYIPATIDDSLPYWRILLIWTVVFSLGRSWIDEWGLAKIIRSTIQELTRNEGIAYREEFLIKILVEHAAKLSSIKEVLRDPEVQNYIHLNRYEGVLYFHKESFEELVYWLFVTSTVDLILQSPDAEDLSLGIIERYDAAQKAIRAAEESGYRFEDTLKRD